MHTITKSIEVKEPLSTVYNQWTQFEEFPQFMDGVERVEQLDDTHLHWKAKIGGREKEWDAEIYEQIPDQSIAWRSISGTQNDGVVSFDQTENGTCITLRLTVEPEGAIEKMGDSLGVLSRRVEGDLKRFKKHLEEHHHETGGWRGEIHHGRVESRGSSMNRQSEPRSKRFSGG